MVGWGLEKFLDTTSLSAVEWGYSKFIQCSLIQTKIRPYIEM
jgi:hypothetical protein